MRKLKNISITKLHTVCYKCKVSLSKSALDLLFTTISDEPFYTGAVWNGTNWTWGLGGETLQDDNFTGNRSGDCVVSSRSGLMAVNCSISYHFVCQLPGIYVKRKK